MNAPAGEVDEAPTAAKGDQGAVDDRERQRLRWQCRRGMLELDLLLNRFLDLGYARLDAEGQATFGRLLAQSDQVLQGWLVGQAVPSDPALSRLIQAIQTTMLAPSLTSTADPVPSTPGFPLS